MKQTLTTRVRESHVRSTKEILALRTSATLFTLATSRVMDDLLSSALQTPLHDKIERICLPVALVSILWFGTSIWIPFSLQPFCCSGDWWRIGDSWCLVSALTRYCIPLFAYQQHGLMDKTQRWRSGIRIPGRGKCMPRTIAVDAGVKYPLYLICLHHLMVQWHQMTNQN